MPRLSGLEFVLCDEGLVLLADITYIDLTQIEKRTANLITKDGKVYAVNGFAALELVWSLKPSALEGRRVGWRKYTWSVHNILAHPIMQLLAYIGCYRAAMWVHDVTVPKPKP